MSPTSAHEPVLRVLIVDDTRSIHADLRKVLATSGGRARPVVAGAESAPDDGPLRLRFDVDSAYQGEEASAMLARAIESGSPYALAFVDMTMPPGWDGFRTARALLAQDPDLHVVLSTANPGLAWSQVVAELGRTDRVLVLKKPYDAVEVLQIAYALGGKWTLARTARARLEELEAVNARLAAEIDRRLRLEAELRYDALHDALTRLPNRALLLERIEQCLRRKRREPEYHFALVFLDLDDFKSVNDSLGHRAGDELLVEISSRILSCVRSTDCTSRAVHNTAARLGGDEFVVLLDGMDAPDGATFVTERILETVAQPLVLEGRQVRPSASAGIALGSEAHRSADDLLRDADCALYRAKRDGKERLSVFDERLHEELLRQIKLESELRHAIEAGALCLHYQPIVDLRTDRIHGFEALVRWDHPEHGRLPPSAFVPLAEEKGLIVDLGAWVLEEACRQTAEWRRRFPEHAELTISVNFAARQLDDPQLVERLERILARTGLRAEDLNLELTETMRLRSTRPGGARLERLQGRALHLHMDDFGATLSSIACLRGVPVRALKLDPGFVRDLGADSTLAPMLQALLAMAHARGLEVIAEGIETPEQLVLLRATGCDYGQGFYFSRPVEASAIEEMLTAGAVKRLA